MKIIGLTGSIAMGKSATGNMFREQGIPVNDSDAVVHELYRNEAVPLLAERFPDAVRSGEVNRTKLGEIVLQDAAQLKLLESIIHPLVEQKRQKFLEEMRKSGATLAVVDIPLLFEIGAQESVDIIAVVSASTDIQRDRALARPGMTLEKFESICAKQIPDKKKRQWAHFVIRSDHGFAHARRQVEAIIRALL